MSPESPAVHETVITVRYWAGARAAAGVEEETLVMAAGARLGELIAELSTRHTALVEVLPACSLLLDGLRSDYSAAIEGSAVLEVLPPFAGG